MGTLAQWFDSHPHLLTDTQMRVADTLLAIVTLSVLRLLVVTLINRRTQDVRVRYLGNKTITYVCTFIGLVWLGRLWLIGFQSLFTVLGLVAAGLTIVLKDVIVNLAGWVFLVTRRPFSVGDRVQIGGVTGDVVDVGLFGFAMLEVGGWVEADQSTGRIVNVPNAFVFTQTLTSYTRGIPFIWNEIPVEITLDSDWQRAKAVLESIVRKHVESSQEEVENAMLAASNDYMIHYSVLTPAVYTKVEDRVVRLTLRYLCHPRRRRDTEENIWEAVLTAFEAEPQVRLDGQPEKRLEATKTVAEPALSGTGD